MLVISDCLNAPLCTLEMQHRDTSLGRMSSWYRRTTVEILSDVPISFSVSLDSLKIQSKAPKALGLFKEPRQKKNVIRNSNDSMQYWHVLNLTHFAIHLFFHWFPLRDERRVGLRIIRDRQAAFPHTLGCLKHPIIRFLWTLVREGCLRTGWSTCDEGFMETPCKLSLGNAEDT